MYDNKDFGTYFSYLLFLPSTSCLSLWLQPDGPCAKGSLDLGPATQPPPFRLDVSDDGARLAKLPPAVLYVVLTQVALAKSVLGRLITRWTFASTEGCRCVANCAKLKNTAEAAHRQCITWQRYRCYEFPVFWLDAVVYGRCTMSKACRAVLKLDILKLMKFTATERPGVPGRGVPPAPVLPSSTLRTLSMRS